MINLILLNQASGKQCKTCKEKKPYSSFPRSRRNIDKHHGSCKECVPKNTLARNAAISTEFYNAWIVKNRELHKAGIKHHIYGPDS